MIAEAVLCLRGFAFVSLLALKGDGLGWRICNLSEANTVNSWVDFVLSSGQIMRPLVSLIVPLLGPSRLTASSGQGRSDRIRSCDTVPKIDYENAHTRHAHAPRKQTRLLVQVAPPSI